MRRGWYLRPTTRLAGVVALGAAAGATMVLAAPSGATGTEKVYESKSTMACVLAPGVLNEPGSVTAEIRGEGPEQVSPGEEFTLHNEEFNLVIPGRLGEELFRLGSREVRGFVTNLPVDVENGTPAKINLARPAAFPNGIPIAGKVESGPLVLRQAPPSPGILVSPPVTSSASGARLSLSLDSAAGFREIGSNPSQYESTNNGVALELTGYSEQGEADIGPVTIACTAPSGVVLASPSVGPSCPNGPEVKAIEPNHGPPGGGGATVQITGCGFENVTGVRFGARPAFGFTVTPPTSITAVSPSAPVPPALLPWSEPVFVETSQGTSRGSVFFTWEAGSPPPRFETATYQNWPLSGSLTPKKLGQAIELPAGSTFNGSAEASVQPGTGKLTGSLSIPPFTTPLKLVGPLPVNLGVTLTQVGAFEGPITTNGIANATLTVPAKLSMGITSIGVLGLRLSLSCATTEPIALELNAWAASPHALLTNGWEFAGATTLPHFKCTGPLGGVASVLLAFLVSGPENPFTLRISPPSR